MAGIELVRKEYFDTEIGKVSGSVTTLEGQVDTKADKAHTHSYSEITGTPTIPSVDGLAKDADLKSLESVVNALKTELEDLKASLEPVPEPEPPIE